MPRTARNRKMPEKKTTKPTKTKTAKRLNPEPAQKVTARTNALHRRLVESGGRQVTMRLDAESSAVLARLEEETGRSPRAIVVALLQRPDIDKIVAKALAAAADAK
jgi:hypothetical protein